MATDAKENRIKPPRGRALLWFVGLLALAAGLIAGWYARDFFAVNACLDAGGSWTNPGVCIGALGPPR